VWNVHPKRLFAERRSWVLIAKCLRIRMRHWTLKRKLLRFHVTRCLILTFAYLHRQNWNCLHVKNDLSQRRLRPRSYCGHNARIRRFARMYVSLS
jgi:hypothetical protein